MVRSINEIGHLTGKQTIAEFAENTEIINMLRTLGVDYAQGYGVSQPQRIIRAAVGVEVQAPGTLTGSAHSKRIDKSTARTCLVMRADRDEVDAGVGDRPDVSASTPPEASSLSGRAAPRG